MRSRNIKPGFFKNEILADCKPLSRILFAGLWCMADREGRLEYRPKRIKAELLPYDNANISELIGELEKHGFINLYSVNSVEYLQVVKFTLHQNPNIKECESTIPAPCQHSTSTKEELLIPDSLIPHTDSLKPIYVENEKTNVSVTVANGSNGSKKYVFKTEYLSVEEKDNEELKKSFPMLDVVIEYQKASSWLMSNPANRKKNIKRFLFNWLNKAQSNYDFKNSKQQTQSDIDAERRRELAKTRLGNSGAKPV